MSFEDDILKLKNLAEQEGYAEAQYLLGMMYGKGQGVPEDIEKAKQLICKAAAQGHQGAKDFLVKVAGYAKK